VLPDEGFEEAARAYAARLAAGPTLAVGAIPGLMRNALAADRPSGLAAERQAQLACLASEDFQEAVRAAVERRDTNFSGR
jgi:2-(1,2-epoxy-1,2-dihydrophenyl)acetyl-CoA isomerase